MERAPRFFGVTPCYDDGIHPKTLAEDGAPHRRVGPGQLEGDDALHDGRHEEGRERAEGPDEEEAEVRDAESSERTALG